MLGTKLQQQILKSIWVLLLVNFKEVRSGCVRSDPLCIEGECRPFILCTNQTNDLLIKHLYTQISDWCENGIHLKICNSEIRDITQNTFENVARCRLPGLILTNDQIKSISEKAFVHHSELKILDLSFNDIVSTKIQANAFGNLESLRILNLSYNQLESVHQGMFRGLKKIEKLYLNNNPLSYIPDATFQSITSLQYLYLNNNRLQTISDKMFLGLQDLRYLDLQENPLTKITPASLQHLEHLISINLTGSSITTLDNNIFLGLSNLEFLNLTHWNIKNIIPGAFNSMNKLTTLDLSQNELELLQNKLFSGLSSLQKLYLNKNKIKAIDKFAFYGLSSIAEITICDENISKFLTPDYNIIALSNSTLDLKTSTFEGLDSLNTLNFVNLSAVSIREGAFQEMNQLRYFNLINTTVDKIETKSFDGCHHIIHIKSQCRSDIKRGEFQRRYDLCGVSIKSIEPDALNGLNYYINSDENKNFLYLHNNNLSVLSNNTFRNVSYLVVLTLDNNNIEEIEPLAFDALNFHKNGYYNRDRVCTTHTCHNALYLNNNKIRILKSNTFAKIQNLVELKLENNNINEIQPGTFTGLSFHSKVYINDPNDSYNVLYLNKNKLTRILNGTFTNISNISVLRLDENNIQNIEQGAFTELFMLETIESYNRDNIRNHVISPNTIYINNNVINSLSRNTFAGIQNLIVLRLDDNKINNIEIGTFTGLETLKILKLNNNNLSIITENLLKPLQRLESLDLTNNKITILNSEIFFGLANLRNLEMAKNQIKDVPLGMLKNFPLLENLQLGENALSQFRTGTFSNLGKLKYLNFSSNKFSALNETVLYPLINLELLDLDNNRFSNVNYSCLLSHLPSLHFISVSDNNWTCEFLTRMLQTFRSKRIHYLFNATSRYTEENVDGISCTEIHSTSSSIHPLEQNESENRLLGMLEKAIPTLNENVKNISDFLNNQEFIKILSKTFSENVENNSSSHILIFILCFILLFLIFISVVLLYIIYKQYFESMRNRKAIKDTYSEIELLNASA